MVFQDPVEREVFLVPQGSGPLGHLVIKGTKVFQGFPAHQDFQVTLLMVVIQIATIYPDDNFSNTKTAQNVFFKTSHRNSSRTGVKLHAM